MKYVIAALASGSTII